MASAPKSSPSKINDEITVLNSSLCQAESVCFVKAAKAYLSWWEQISVPHGYKVVLRRGEVAPLDKTVGGDRAVRKMVDRAVKVAGGRPVDVAVEHIGEDDRVPGVLHALRDRVVNLKELLPVSVTSIITAHVGPGAMGITISPAV